jgi:hypothetical protein
MYVAILFTNLVRYQGRCMVDNSVFSSAVIDELASPPWRLGLGAG